jgi:3-oxoacyl-[acyl-carrier protein] reductase
MARGKSAIVTGSSRGIGRAIAKRLAADGVQVVVNYRSDAEAAKEVVASIEADGGTAVALQADSTVPAELTGLFEAAQERFGSLDILVSNVGTARFKPLPEITDEDFDLMFGTNVKATLLAVQEASRRIADNGRIVLISSGTAAVVRPGGGVYGASKAALEHIGRSAAHELAQRGVTVNSVRPGATDTDALRGTTPAEIVAQIPAMTPLGRLGQPEDIAEVVAFLASDGGRWITGQVINAGGGLF